MKTCQKKMKGEVRSQVFRFPEQNSHSDFQKAQKKVQRDAAAQSAAARRPPTPEPEDQSCKLSDEMVT